MRSLIERQGGAAFVAPSMREIPLGENQPAKDFAVRLMAGEIDVMIFLTGVGARYLLEVVEPLVSRSDFFAALEKCFVAVRGPKPWGVLREWGVRIDCRAPEPNTWHELLSALEATPSLALTGQRITIQEYGKPSEELAAALAERGAEVVAVPVYRWGMPEDLGPLDEAIAATVRGEFDVLLFTSAQQVVHVLERAEETGRRGAWLAAARGCCVGSIGPTATDMLIELGLPPDLEASPPKMGQLVKTALSQGRAVLARKISEMS